MEDIELKQDLLRSLNHGQDHAIPGNLLAQRLGERDTRRIRRAIIDLIIEDGVPIIGDSGRGYFIAETKEECKKCLETLMSYLKMVGRHHKYLLQASQKLIKPEQMKLNM